MAATGFMELLLILFFGGGSLNLPVGLPPEAEDPKMSQVAPEQALIYLSWAGTADADGKSANASERLLADPQVKFFAKKLEDAIVGTIKAQMRRDEEQALLKHGHLLIKQMLLRPTTIYVAKADLFNDAPNIEAGLVINFGKDAAAAKIALEALEAMIAKELGKEFEVMPAKDGGLRRMPIPDNDAPLVAWGFEGDYMMLAVGKETATRLRGALTGGKAPAWLTEAKTKLAPKRLSSFTYINVAQVLKQFGPMLASQMMGGPEGKAQFDRIISALALDKAKYFAATTGFDDVKFVSRSLLAVDPAAGGVFKLVSSKGLTLADLADVPRDADLALVTRLNAAEIWDEVFKIMAAIDPGLKDEAIREMKNAEEELGFRVKEDFIDALGDVWSIYNSPGEGGLVITGLTGVVQLKDAKKAQKVVDFLEKSFNQEWNRNGGDDPQNPRRRRYEIKTLVQGEHKIRYINPVGDDWVVAPAWCVTADRFVIAPYPQMIRSYLARTSDKKAGSLADVPQVKAMFTAAGGPASLTYVDTPELFKKFYPLLHGAGVVMLADMQRHGFDMDITALPTASSILPFLSPDTGTVSRTADGILSESHQSVPLSSAGAAMPMVMAAFVMPAVAYRSHEVHPPFPAHEPPVAVAPPAPPRQPAPPITTAGKRTVAMNELRQVGIGLFVYHTEKNASAPSLADLKPYLDKEIKNDPWGQPYLYYGKNLAPAGKDAAKTPFASTSHAIDGKRIVLYGDAHVESIVEKDFKKQMEDAKLEYKEPVELKRDDAKEPATKDGKQGRVEEDGAMRGLKPANGAAIRVQRIEIAPIEVQVELELEAVPAEKK